MTDFRQAKRDCAISIYSRLTDRAGVRVHARRYINSNGNFFRGIDQPNQTQCARAKLTIKTRTQQPVNYRVRKSKRHLQTFPRSIAV